MTTTTLIHNGLVVSPELNNNTPTRATLEISGNTLVDIRTDTPTNQAHDQTGDLIQIDAEGCWILPSFIDLCHHIREPGFEHKGDIASETAAAASAGFTHIVCPPTTMPIIDNSAVATLIQNRAEQAGHCTILPLGAITQGLNDHQLSEMYALKEAGCVGVSTGEYANIDNRTLMRCLEYAGTFNLPVHFRPNDASLSQGGIMHDGALAHQLGIPGIPACAESIALARDLQLVSETGICAHFSRLSCKASLNLIAEAKAKGLQVTCDVSLQHLLLTDEALTGFNSLYLERPPFRSESDRLALINGVIDGTIDAICSNHQPHELAAKMAPLGDSQAGLSTLDTFVPSLVSLMDETGLSLPTLCERLSLAPVSILQQSAQSSPLPTGQIKRQMPANITVIDPSVAWRCEPERLISKGQNCSKLGHTLYGRVAATFHCGKASYLDLFSERHSVRQSGSAII